jgi:hypothetical protein
LVLKSLYSYPNPPKEQQAQPQIKTFKGYEYGEAPINYSFNEYRPFELHHNATGAAGDKPSFAIAMENAFGQKVIGQVSLDMLNSALVSFGYQIIKF